MLTKKQLDLLNFIHRRLQKDGVPPSFDEMKVALDLRSKSGIHRLITALEERGFIRRLAHRARAIEILRLPENMGGVPAPSTNQTTAAGDFSRHAPQHPCGICSRRAGNPCHGAHHCWCPNRSNQPDYPSDRDPSDNAIVQWQTLRSGSSR